MPGAVPSPPTTLVLLLGASEWPYSPDFPQSHAFTNAARRLKGYFLDPQTFGLPRENLLDLFDSDQSADDLDREIGQFLEQRISRMQAGGHAARDVVVYFVGHGGLAGGDVEYYLAIRRTRMANPTASGIRIVSLAHTLKEQARYLRRIVILDCCFAAAAFRAFQAAPDQAAITQTLEAFKVPGKGEGIPGRGTSLLCSSRHNRPSLLLPDGSSTMFSEALLEALTIGNPYRQGHLSLHDVASLAEDVLHVLAPGDAPRPEVHSPDQSEGDIANLPFFPNPAALTARASVSDVLEQAGRSQQISDPPRPSQPDPQPASLPLPKPSTRFSLQLKKELPSQRPQEIIPRGKPLSSRDRRDFSRGKVALLLTLVSFVVLGSIGLFSTRALNWIRASPRPTVIATYTLPANSNSAMFGFDLQHTHFNPFEDILNIANVSRLVPYWIASTESVIFSSPTVANGVVYVGSLDY